MEAGELFVFHNQEQNGSLELLYSHKYGKNGNWSKKYTRLNGSKK